MLDVGGVYGPGRAERLQAQRREDAGEDLRLLYVGLTRAQCSVVTWWADSARNTTGSPLHRLLFRGAQEVEPAPSYPIPAEPLEALRGRPGATVEVVEDRAPRPMAEPGPRLRRPDRADLRPVTGPGMAADLLLRADRRRTRPGQRDQPPRPVGRE